MNDESTELPEVLPLFPLTGVLLLPRASLPLNIFERRYLDMASAAMSGDGMIGVVQPQILERDPIPTQTPLYEIGCVGKIVSFNETKDGRNLITLAGTSRFKITEEVSMGLAYRSAKVSYDLFQNDLLPSEVPLERERRFTAIRAYFDYKNIQTDWNVIENATDEAVVSSLAMGCPFEGVEKQALLECIDLKERSDLLTSLMEMAVQESGVSVTPTTQ
jgi:Lon protease-like protein